MATTSTKPYLIRAIHEWCTDNGFRPYLAVAVDANTIVPREFVRGGEIVLNVSIDATNRLQLRNDLIEFEARFGGVARQVSVPVDNVTAIYAAENGHGMSFDVPKPPAEIEEIVPTDEAGRGAGEALGADRIVTPSESGSGAEQGGETSGPAPAVRGPVLLESPGSTPSDGRPGEPGPGPARGGRPHLTRIK